MGDAPDTPAAGRQLATTPPAREVRVVEELQPLFDTARFEHFQRAASALMHSTLLPESVRANSPQECFSNLMMVFDQAERWAMPALAVAQCVSVIRGKLVYEGKLVAAVVDARLGVKLDYEWTGDVGSDSYAIRVFGVRPGETVAREVRGTVADWATAKDNKRNPQWVGQKSTMQLAYRGAREWIRLWAPALLLGVYGDDEIEGWEDRRDARAAAQSSVSGPAITAGFASQPVAAVDAEFVDEAQGSPSAGDKAATPDTAADAGASPDAPAPAQDGGKSPEPPKETAAAKKARERDEKNAADTAARLEAAERADLAGKEARRTGSPEAANPFNEKAESELFHSWRNGWIVGDEEMQREAAEAGGADDDDDDQGGQAADADAANDPKPADPPAQVVEEEAAPFTAFDFFNGGLRDCVNWGAVKQSLAALSRTDDWKAAAADPASTLIRQARIGAWCRVLELQASGTEAVDFINDITAFRCWAEHADDDALILERWSDVVETAAYASLTDAQRAQLKKGVEGRVSAIRAAGAGGGETV